MMPYSLFCLFFLNGNVLTETATAEISVLKKKISENSDLTRYAVEEVRSENDREMRQLRNELAAQRLAVQRSADAEIAKLRSQQTQDMTELRKVKDHKLESVVAQYERHLSELKTAHERHIGDLHSAKEEYAAKIREEITQRLTEAQSGWKKRLNEEHRQHAHEIQTLMMSYQENLQTQLSKKAEEIANLRKSFDAQKAEMERMLLLSERRLEDEKLQRDQVIARTAKEVADSAASAATDERDRANSKIESIKAENAEVVRALEDSHSQTISSLSRTIQMLNEKLELLTKEMDMLAENVKSKDSALSASREELTKVVEKAEVEKKTEMDVVLKEKEELRVEVIESWKTISRLKEEIANTEKSDRLNER